METSVLRDNKYKLETDGQFTSKWTSLEIMPKDGENHNYDPIVVPNKNISPYNNVKVVIG
jgi:hypothetical protein